MEEATSVYLVREEYFDPEGKQISFETKEYV